MIVKASEIKEKILDKVNEIADCMKEGKDATDKIGNLLDLGVFQDELNKSDGEFTDVMITDGIHQSVVKDEGEFSPLMTALLSVKKAHTDKDGEVLVEAVKSLNEIFTKEETPGEKTPGEKNETEKGASLAKLLNDEIDKKVEAGTDRSELLESMGKAGGISASTVSQILRAEINDPPAERLRGFAGVLGLSVESVFDAAERDGGNPRGEKEKKAETEKSAPFVWGSDMSSARQAARQQMSAKKKADKEQIRKEKLDKVQEDSFSWDNIKDGE